MTRATAEVELGRIEEILARACGFSLSRGLRHALQTSVVKAAEAMHLEEGEFHHRLAKGDQETVACLVEHSVIGETYFFRHPEHFAALAAELAGPWRDEPALHFWSAACASGEEPYSLAITLQRAGRPAGADTVLATDVSERALRTARDGHYGSWSLRRLDPAIRRAFFAGSGDQLKISQKVQSAVDFRRHNLATDPVPASGLHVIFCRNVLIYFAPDLAARVLHRLADTLRPGGLLFLGPVEVPMATTLALEWVDSHGTTLLRKPDGSRPAQKPRPAAKPAARSAAPKAPASLAQAHAPAKETPRRRSQPEPTPAPSEPPTGRFELAREAARCGRLDEAEQLARESAREDVLPESYLLLAMTAESRGDLKAAVEAVRRALYLDPALATGHATLVSLFKQLGRAADSEKSRLNALRALEGLDESSLLRGVEAITAGALRRALERPGSER